MCECVITHHYETDYGGQDDAFSAGVMECPQCEADQQCDVCSLRREPPQQTQQDSGTHHHGFHEETKPSKRQGRRALKSDATLAAGTALRVYLQPIVERPVHHPTEDIGTSTAGQLNTRLRTETQVYCCLSWPNYNVQTLPRRHSTPMYLSECERNCESCVSQLPKEFVELDKQQDLSSHSNRNNLFWDGTGEQKKQKN